jgi:hypothetical protein
MAQEDLFGALVVGLEQGIDSGVSVVDSGKPIGSAVQVETLPEVYPPKGFTETDGAYAARVVTWGARTRTITFVVNDGTLMGTRQTTTALPFTATAADIETALVALGAIAAGDISVSGSGRKFTYAFGGAYANRAVRQMYSTLDGQEGKRVYFDVVQVGVSEAGQQAIKREVTDNALGIEPEDFINENVEQPYDIGDPRRYNPDGSPKYN